MRICEKRRIGEGNWLYLSEIEYTDHEGKLRTWESVSRKKTGGAVLIIAKLVPSGKLILIRQFRPPTGKTVLEFPAGLVDPGETFEEAAVRELREETGYCGVIDSVSVPGYSSPGMSSETVCIARMTVMESEQKELKTDFDESEYIETLTVAPEDLPDLIRREDAAGTGIDIKVAAFSQTLK